MFNTEEDSKADETIPSSPQQGHIRESSDEIFKKRQFRAFHFFFFVRFRETFLKSHTIFFLFCLLSDFG